MITSYILKRQTRKPTCISRTSGYRTMIGDYIKSMTCSRTIYTCISVECFKICITCPTFTKGILSQKVCNGQITGQNKGVEIPAIDYTVVTIQMSNHTQPIYIYYIVYLVMYAHRFVVRCFVMFLSSGRIYTIYLLLFFHVASLAWSQSYECMNVQVPVKIPGKMVNT